MMELNGEFKWSFKFNWKKNKTKKNKTKYSHHIIMLLAIIYGTNTTQIDSFPKKSTGYLVYIPITYKDQIKKEG